MNPSVLHAEQGRSSTGTMPGTAVAQGFNLAGFFPGLGSRAAYREVGWTSIGSASESVVELYQEAADALQIVNGPEGLSLTAANLPEDPVERQGFIGAGFLAHNLALNVELRERAAQTGVAHFVAYTGESFGVLASAVACGALSIQDSVLVARAFTPLLLAASNQEGRGPLGASLARYLPRYSRERPPITEPAHVIALKAEPHELRRLLGELAERYRDDVEVHKRYSPKQTNVYVRAGFISMFAEIIRAFPGVKAEELKEPTKFLAHSRKMIEARESLDHYMDDQGVRFADPHTPMISNSGGSFLITGDQVRSAVLAMTNEVMDSQRTVELIDELRPDMVVEIGRGGKSLDLLQDNWTRSPAIAFTGAHDASTLLDGAGLVVRLRTALQELRSAERVGPEPWDYDLLHRVNDLARAEPAFEKYLLEMACALPIQPDGAVSAAYLEMSEALKYTLAHRRHVLEGELVVGARLKKRLDVGPGAVGQAFTELCIRDAKGRISTRTVVAAEDAEALVVHFGKPRKPQLLEAARAARMLVESQPIAQRIRARIAERLRADNGATTHSTGLRAAIAEAEAIDLLVYQVSMFELLKQHRPGLFAHNHAFLEGGDAFGWLVALVASGAATPGDVIELGAHIVSGRLGETGLTDDIVGRLGTRLTDATVPVLSSTGAPVETSHDLAAETATICRPGELRRGKRPIRLNASCTILALGSSSRTASLDTTPHANRILTVRTAEELWRRGLNRDLDAMERRALLTASSEQRAVMRYAQQRSLLCSTVCAYMNPGEILVGFGNGGSESMTVFFRRRGESELLVRKVLSEALTTARWDPEGQGAMLPPFTKAKKQAEYLMALPASVRDYFPQVYSVLEREVRPLGAADGDPVRREVIYEMSFVPGDEVGQYIASHVPPPVVVARLYQEIAGFVHRNIHTARQVPSPRGTLEEQYFRKIEDRLDLCRRTAPATFGPGLLDTDEIVINGRRYLNHRRLLEEFRREPMFQQVLEPSFHSLVVGDTNTENIKIGDTAPLVRAQAVIESGAGPAEIREALAAITSASIGLKFLDPRAIGWRSDGATTSDDPMYDNKPWHNSVGHYDEMHNEAFDLAVSRGPDGSPDVTIDFHRGNPYQSSYRVRDVTERGLAVTPDAPRGIEDYFAQVMTDVYGLDDPAAEQHQVDPYWIIRFVFTMGTHFTAMPPFHFASEIDGTVVDSPDIQRRPIAIYCEGIKWLNWSLQMLTGSRPDFLGVPVPLLPELSASADDASGVARKEQVK